MTFFFFGFMILCIFSYWHFYKKNYASNQNDQIILLLKEKNAQKHENIFCTIIVGLSLNMEKFDIYVTNNSIVLIRSYVNYFGNVRLKKRAETYLIIIKDEEFPINLFTNYIKVKSLDKKKGLVIIGDLYSKNPFLINEFIYSLEVKIMLAGLDI